MNGWKLAPAYDLTYSDTYWGEHTTSVNGKGKAITKEDMLKLGMDAGLSEDFCADCYDEINTKTKVLEKYLTMVHGSEEHIPFQERLKKRDKS